MQINPVTYNSYKGNGRVSNVKTDPGGFASAVGKVSAKHSEHKVYMKTDDMLYSGGNGTGLSFYLKYAEDSTAENPRVVAKGIDENGQEFEQTIDVRDINPHNATIVEMRALEAVSDAPKRNGFSSLPIGLTNVGLNVRQDYIVGFRDVISDMQTLGQYGLAQEYKRLQSFYEDKLLDNKAPGEIGGTGISSKIEDKPVWHWHDGQFGYSAEVYKNEDSASEYTVKLKYDNGKEEERVVDADKVNASSCNIVDLSVRMYHLEAEGKIDDPNPQILLAHLYMQHRTPDADENTLIDFKSWYEQQLELEMNNDRNEKNISRLMNLLKYL